MALILSLLIAAAAPGGAQTDRGTTTGVVIDSSGAEVALSEFFGVRTAWHGPGDASPAAHAAQLD